jgi:transglutaminase-like putative cysteine protease
MVIALAAAVFLAAAGWMILRQLDLTSGFKPAAGGYTIAKTIQYSYTLQNKSGRMVPRAELWAHAPVRQTAGQRCRDLTANYPFKLLADEDGNQVLHFSFENLAPYASRIITIKAKLLLASSANPVHAEPGASDLKPEKYVESNHPSMRQVADKLKQSDTDTTIDAMFRWVASHVRYSGYADQERGALYALEEKKGDCTEYMDLFAALCRANGIPARRIGGYICPESTVLKARDYHNWVEFYEGGTWQIADPQNKVLKRSQDDYIAMRIIRASKDNPLEEFNRFRVKGDGLTVRMN